MNIVRMKYLEPPFFMQVNGIASSFDYRATAGGSANLPESVRENRAGNANVKVYNVNVGGSYAEHPTITYTPLQGEQYITNVMAPIDMTRFMMLYRTGWTLEFLMRTLVDRVGNLQNLPIDKRSFPFPAAQATKPGELKSTYEDFLEFMRILERIQWRGDLEIVKVTGKGMVLSDSLPPAEVTASNVIAAEKEGYHFVKNEKGLYDLRKIPPPSFAVQIRFLDDAEAERVKSLLGSGLQYHRTPDGRPIVVFKMATGRDLSRDRQKEGALPEVDIQLRSLWDVLWYLARGVEVPEADIEKGLVKRFETPEGQIIDPRPFTKDLLDVRYSALPPSNAYTSIRYRGGWFYIDDSDFRSKLVFNLLSTLFSLQSGKAEGVQPVLTIPVGG